MKSKILLFCLLLVVVAGCKDSNEPGDVSTITELNDLINSVATFPPPSPYGKDIDYENMQNSSCTVFVEDNKWYTTNDTPYKFTRPFEAIINLNANQSDIYPGSIVQGKYLTEGRAVSIGDNFARKPITLTMANGGSSVQINNPTYAEISTAMNDLVAEQKPMPAVLNYEIVNMYSAEQALMEFGLDIDWGFLTASGMYSNSTTDNKNSVLLCFKQLYYTMSIGNNRGATDLFADNVDVEQLKTKTGEGNPLCVIN